MRVFKFGGASVKDGASVQNVVKILQKYPTEKLVVVLSAMGKMTNAFEVLAQHHHTGKRDDCLRHLDYIRSFHLELMHPLFPDPSDFAYNTIDKLLAEVEAILSEPNLSSFDKFYDQLIPYGELLSTNILSHYLHKSNINHQLIDARRIITTDAAYREARVNWDRTKKNVNKLIRPFLTDGGEQRLVLTQGFIGADINGHTTTLGREGSDYTAAVLAYCLDAREVVIWKDVPGLLNADPKIMPNTVKFSEISYGEAIELAYYGATIIHPKTIKPLENKKIPLYIKPFTDPDAAGSVIHHTETESPSVASYIFKFNQTLLSITPRDYSFINTENLSDIFAVFKMYGLKINLMQNSAISFSVCFDSDRADFDTLLQALQVKFKVLYNYQLELITIRNYQHAEIGKVLQGRTILLEQRSRNTLQMLVSGK
ncbi:MAG: aspartate kinase [Bacteroidales bacterium]|nr:aspartate kinase [Bacteroidales bacterium]MDZ4203390.1 aspartate kinase [Bacteroidales bacterium]